MFKICFMVLFFLTGGNITTQGFCCVYFFQTYNTSLGNLHDTKKPDEM